MSTYLLLKNTIRNKSFLFWCVAFPIILSSLFYIAFSGLLKPDTVQLDIAVSADNDFLSIYQSISVLNVETSVWEEAEKALKSDDIIAYIAEDNQVFIAKNSMATTIISSIVEQIEQTRSFGMDYVYVDFTETFVANSKQDDTLSTVYIPFYSLIAMISTYAAHTVLGITLNLTANLSTVGQRVETAPTRKSRLLAIALILGIVINFIACFICLLYMKYVLKLPLFEHFIYTLLMVLVVNIFGAALGLALNTSRLNYNIKSSIVTVSSIILSFLSGMMLTGVRNLIIQKAPILAKINPVSLATTGLYQLNFLADSSSYYQGVVTILVISLILFVYSIFVIRRRKYVYL